MVLVPLAMAFFGGDNDSNKRDRSNSESSVRRVSPRFSNRSCASGGSSFSFSNVDMLESGSAREFVDREMLSPHKSKRTRRKCNILREGKTKFWLYGVNGRGEEAKFLLSAKFVDDAFYISQYEDFPWGFTGPSPPCLIVSSSDEDGDNVMGSSPSSATQHLGFCNVLKVAKKRLTLYSCSCEYCDDILGKFTCAPPVMMRGESGTCANAAHERQVLAEIRHGNAWVGPRDEGCMCNTVHVKIPTVYEDMSRQVWCPRVTLRPRSSSSASNPELSLDADVPEQSSSPNRRRLKRSMSYSEAESRVSSSSSSSRSLRKDMFRMKRAESAPADDAQQNAKSAIELATQLPRFDAHSGSLKMRFYDDRIRAASSKNMILRRKGDEGSSGCILQLGKADKFKYCVDYAHPLAPVQAFAVALSLFRWQAEKHK